MSQTHNSTVVERVAVMVVTGVGKACCIFMAREYWSCTCEPPSQIWGIHLQSGQEI